MEKHDRTEENTAGGAEERKEETAGLDAVSGEKPDTIRVENLIELLKESLDRLQRESEDFMAEEDYIFSCDLEEDGGFISS